MPRRKSARPYQVNPESCHQYIQLPVHTLKRLQHVSSFLGVQHHYEAVDLLISYWYETTGNSSSIPCEEETLDLRPMDDDDGHIQSTDLIVSEHEEDEDEDEVEDEDDVDEEEPSVTEEEETGGDRTPTKRRPGRPRKNNSTTTTTVKKNESRKCDYCGATVMKNKMKIHITTHASDFPFPCSACTGTIKCWKDWRRHENLHKHDREDNLMCPVCGKNYRTYNGFRVHKLVHKNELSGGLVCEKCAFRTNDRTVLYSHIRYVHGERHHECTRCAKKFTLQSKLKEHIDTVHGNVRKYLCADCGQSFKRNDALKVHKRIHSGDKPFACHLCDYKGRQRHALNSHLQTTHHFQFGGSKGVGRPRKSEYEEHEGPPAPSLIIDTDF